MEEITVQKHVEGGAIWRGGDGMRVRPVRRRHVAVVEVLVRHGRVRLFGKVEGREEMVRERARRGGWVDEVGASLEAAHGSSGAVVSASGFLSRVEGTEPAPLLRLRVPYLGGVTAPRPPPNSAVPHCADAGAAVFSERPLVGCGGALLLGLGDGIHWVGFWDGGEPVEAPKCFFHVGVSGRGKVG